MAHGSLINTLYDQSDAVHGAKHQWKVGDGATYCGWSDRNAYTVIAVTRCSITLRRDKATRTDTNRMSDAQSYTFEPDPEGRVIKARLTKRGWRVGGQRGAAIIPGRDEFYDYSF